MGRKGLLLSAGGVAGLALAAMLKGRRRPEWLKDKVVLITGSSRGFGLAMAEEFAKHGARLVLTARDPYELERARQKLLQGGLVASPQAVLSLACDLTGAAETQEMAARATEYFGRIDILVNNAGIISVGPVEDQPLAAFKQAIEANYYCALHATMAVLPAMLARGAGSIVNIASIGGKLAVPHLLPYSASKFALVGFSQGLNAEVRSKGIQVTTVCPGLMRTGSHIHAQFRGDREREYRWFSLGASLPGVSIGARAAARKVVRATIAGVSEITITPQAWVGAKAAQLAPGLTAAALGLVNSVILPRPVSGNAKDALPGGEVDGKELSPLTMLGESASYKLNEL